MATAKTNMSGLTEYEQEVLHLLDENNTLLKEIISILRDNNDRLVDLQHNVRKIKSNTN
jgi:hypothetical protein